MLWGTRNWAECMGLGLGSDCLAPKLGGILSLLCGPGVGFLWSLCFGSFICKDVKKGTCTLGLHDTRGIYSPGLAPSEHLASDSAIPILC